MLRWNDAGSSGLAAVSDFQDGRFLDGGVEGPAFPLDFLSCTGCRTPERGRRQRELAWVTWIPWGRTMLPGILPADLGTQSASSRRLAAPLSRRPRPPSSRPRRAWRPGRSALCCSRFALEHFLNGSALGFRVWVQAWAQVWAAFSSLERNVGLGRLDLGLRFGLGWGFGFRLVPVLVPEAAGAAGVQAERNGSTPVRLPPIPPGCASIERRKPAPHAGRSSSAGALVGFPALIRDHFPGLHQRADALDLGALEFVHDRQTASLFHVLCPRDEHRLIDSFLGGSQMAAFNSLRVGGFDALAGNGR